MSARAAMSLPGGRVILGWWCELASLEPRRLGRYGAGGWEPTEAGKQPASSWQATPARHLERRTFCFTEGQPSLFVPLAATAPLLPATPGADWRFDLAVLEACIREPD